MKIHTLNYKMEDDDIIKLLQQAHNINKYLTRIPVCDTPPKSKTGMIYFDLTEKKLMIYYDDKWNSIT